MCVTDVPTRRPTRELIWDAATELFRKRGYATTVRDIAKAAGVDPALVIRYYQSKELLFLATMSARIPDRPLDELDVPMSTLGEHIVRFVLSSEKELREVFVALVRASDAHGVNTRLRDIQESIFIAPLTARMDGRDKDLRARLAISLVGGLMYELWVVGDDILAATEQDVIVSRYGALLQQVIGPAQGRPANGQTSSDSS